MDISLQCVVWSLILNEMNSLYYGSAVETCYDMYIYIALFYNIIYIIMQNYGWYL